MTSAPTAAARRPDPDSVHEALELTLRIGEALLSAGMPARKVTHALRRTLSAYGVDDVSADVTFSAITLSWPGPRGRRPATYNRIVEARTQDFTRLARVAELVDDIASGRVGIDQARVRLDEATTADHPYRAKLAAVSWGVLAAAVAVLLGGGVVVTATAYTTAVLIYALNRWLHRHEVPLFFQQLAGALVATGSAVALRVADVSVSPSLVIATGIVVLLSGLTFTGAVEDALTGYYLTAAGRLLEVAVLTGGVIAGVVTGMSLADRFGITFSTMSRVFVIDELPVQVAAAAVASAAFAYCSYAPKRTLVAAGVAGGLSQAVAVAAAGAGVVWASGTAATVVGFGAYLVAGRIRVPGQMLVAAGIIPLVPGLAIYRGLYQMFEDIPIAGIGTLVTALTTAVALAAGAWCGERLAAPVRARMSRTEQFLIDARQQTRRRSAR